MADPRALFVSFDGRIGDPETVRATFGTRHGPVTVTGSGITRGEALLDLVETLQRLTREAEALMVETMASDEREDGEP